MVSEVFGPTFQGEGPSAGRRCGFVRLGRCNLSCSWCDTPYTWDWDRYDPKTELTRMPIRDVLTAVDQMGVDMVVITGGEPLLQRRAVRAVAGWCKVRRIRVEVETNGTVTPGPAFDLVDQFNVSPKLANSGMSYRQRIRPTLLGLYARSGRAAFKFVVAGEEDLDEVEEIVTSCGLSPVWIMPEATSKKQLEERLVTVAPATLARGWNLSSRLHVSLWGTKRGV